MGIIILDSVRIEAYEFHVAHDKREVLIPKDFTKYLVAITDHVVIISTYVGTFSLDKISSFHSNSFFKPNSV